VKPPFEAGRVLARAEFVNYYKQLVRDCRHTGMRPGDHLPLLDFPLLMQPGEWPRLARLAEKLSGEIAAAEEELLERPELHDRLGLPREVAEVLRDCRRRCRPKGFGRVMRFDFYHTREGWRFSEANPDAVGGWIPAYAYAKSMASWYPGYTPPPNPAAAYAKAMRQFAGKGATVAMFHVRVRAAAWCPRFILKEVEMQGMNGFLSNPRRVSWKSNFAEILSRRGRIRPDLMVRLIITTWFTKLRNRALWAPWFCGSKTPTSNPGSAILIESKRFSLLLAELATRTPTFGAYSPESRSPLEVPRRSQDQWVFKPAFGVGGHGIGLAGISKRTAFERIAERARRNPSNWVAQRRFESVPVETERGPGHVCLGIFTVNGAAAGVYGRIRGTPLINQHAMNAVILIPEQDLGAERAPRKFQLVKNST